MVDLAMVVLAVAAFAACALFVRVCERL